MLHVILFSNQGRPDDISIPLWEPLATVEDIGVAHAVFKRAVAKCNATQLLWVEVTADNMIGLRGYLDVADGIDYEAAEIAAGAAGWAAAAIMEEVGRFRGLKGDVYYAPAI